MAVAAPVIADLAAWAGLTTPNSDTNAMLTEVLAASLDAVGTRCVDVTALDYPVGMRIGVLIHAHRLLKRRMSPEGVAGFNDMGVVRISGLDTDVERLLGRWLLLDGFA